MSEVRPGDVIAGKFEIERVLGEGGMGYVVAARHLQLGQTVALKFIRPDVLTPEYKSRFLREARHTVRLRSKHVSRVLDVGALEGGSPYMVMEFLEGTDLSELLQKDGALAAPVACEYVIQACEAIAEAHSYGIVHRDLKPANLFLVRGSGGEPVVKVLDFGVSKTLDDEAVPGGRTESVVTKVSDLLGSPSYIAPEQVVSARNANASSDVWSLGVILYRFISGKAPFAGTSLGELIHSILHGPIPNLRDACPDLPAGLEQVVARCLDRDSKARPTAVELARLLAPYAGPNAAPSLERIAILGPALVVAEHGSRPSFSGPVPSGTFRPQTQSKRSEASADGRANTLVSAILLGAFALSVSIVGLRFRTGTLHPPPPVEVLPAPAPTPAASSVELPFPTTSASSAPPASASAKPIASAKPVSAHGKKR
jgi:serine/threonine-protein kinase